MRNFTILSTLVLSAACGASVDASEHARDGVRIDPTQTQWCPAPGAYGTTPPQVLMTYDPRVVRQGFAALTSTTRCPNGDQACAEHTAFLPAAGARWREPLMVFLPGTRNTPQHMQYVQQMGAYAGYRTVGLSYDNELNPADLCGDRADVAAPQLRPCTDACPDRVRAEILTGEDASPDLQIARGDAIVERLYLLLSQLDHDRPGDGWGAYFVPHDPATLTSVSLTDIRWNNIVLVGFSQGGGHAAFISKMVAQVHGAFMIDAQVDYCRDGLRRPVANWIRSARDLSAGRRRFAIHREGWDSNELLWPALGIVSTGALAATEDTTGALGPLVEDPPRDGAWTAQQPPTGCDGTHLPMAQDACMPDALQRGARASRADDAWLFPAYLLRLCYADTSASAR